MKSLTLFRKQWYKSFESPSKLIFIVHLLLGTSLKLMKCVLSGILSVPRMTMTMMYEHWTEVPKLNPLKDRGVTRSIEYIMEDTITPILFFGI